MCSVFFVMCRGVWLKSFELDHSSRTSSPLRCHRKLLATVSNRWQFVPLANGSEISSSDALFFQSRHFRVSHNALHFVALFILICLFFLIICARQVPLQNADSNYSSWVCHLFKWSWILKSAFKWRLYPLSQASLTLKPLKTQDDKAMLWHSIVKHTNLNITECMCTGSRGF